MVDICDYNQWRRETQLKSTEIQIKANNKQTNKNKKNCVAQHSMFKVVTETRISLAQPKEPMEYEKP